MENKTKTKPKLKMGFLEPKPVQLTRYFGKIVDQHAQAIKKANNKIVNKP